MKISHSIYLINTGTVSNVNIQKENRHWLPGSVLDALHLLSHLVISDIQHWIKKGTYLNFSAFLNIGMDYK